MVNPCIEKHYPELAARHEALVKTGMSDKDAAMKAAMEEHEKLFNDLNKFKMSIGIKLNKDKRTYIKPDISSRVKEINDKYANLIEKERSPKATPPVLTKQERTNDLIALVAKFNDPSKIRKGSKEHTDTKNKILLEVKELGIPYRQHGSAIELQTSGGKKLQTRNTGINSSESDTFKHENYDEKTHEFVKEALDNPDIISSLHIEGNDGRKMSVANGDAAKNQHYADIAASKPNKATGRIAIDPIIGQEPKGLSKILKDFSTAVKQKLFYAKTGRGAAGTYSPSNKAIKLRNSGDLDTSAHEIAHMVDDSHGIINLIEKNPAALSELPYFINSPAASTPPKGHPNPARYSRNEGFAEWLRAYIVNPAEAQKKAPELFKIYDENVNEKMKAAVQTLSDDIRIWAGSSGRDMVLSNVEYKPEEAKGLIKKIFSKDDTTGNFNLSFADSLKAKFLQPLQAFNKAFEFAKGIRGINEVLPENDPIILSRLYLGIDGKMNQILENGMIDGKANILKDKDGHVKNLDWLLSPFDNTDVKSIEQDMKDTMAYMVAERTIELSKRFDKNSVISGIGGGIFSDVHVAQKTLNEFTNGNPGRLERIQKAADHYREFADDILQYLVDKDRMSKFQYDMIKKENLQYVAMNRILESEPGTEIEVFKGTGKGVGTSKKIDYQIKGSVRKIGNPYVSLLDSLHKSVSEADRNEVLLAFRDMIHAPRGMNDGPVENFADIGVIGKAGDSNTIKIFKDGKAEHWIFNPAIYRAIKGLDNDGYKLPEFLTFPAKLLRFTVTHFPTFAVRNFIRDTQDRLIKSQTGSGFRDLVGDKQHWNDIAKAGGLNAGFYFKDKVHYYGLLETTIDEIAKNKKFILLDPVKLKDLWHSYEGLLYKSETTNRVAEYRAGMRKGKEMGMDDYNASLFGAYKARDLIDFAVAGHTMKIINQVIPFSNAAVQGIRSSAVSLATNPASFMARTMLYSILPGAALWALNYKDEDTAEEYENLPAYQRDMYYNYKIGDNKWIVIPKPFELSITGAGIDRLMSKVKYPKENSFDGYAGSIAKSFLPFDEGGFAGPFKPEVEAMTNYDFFRNKTVIPAREEKLNLALRNTEHASKLGQILEKYFSLDARKADHMIKGHFSYFGDAAMKLSNIGNDQAYNHFGLPDIGFFKQSPAYNSPTVQNMIQFAEEWNLQQSKDYKEFSKLAGEYFDTKDESEKERDGKELIEHAKVLMIKWGKEHIAAKKIKKMEAKR